jgi:hypothetical protein
LGDIDELTVFADSVVPHMLGTDGVLVYDPELASRIDAGIELSAGRAMERELRACTVPACERLGRRLGVPPPDTAHDRATAAARWRR